MTISKDERNKRLERGRSRKEIKALKKRLADSDYMAIKYAEGLISEEDYQPLRAERQAFRDEINRLERLREEGGHLDGVI